MHLENADVLVIGLGPAGASAAAQAARCGCRVIAVDRRSKPGVPVQCAEFVPAMIGLDVAEVATSVKQHIRRMTTYVERDAPDVRGQFPGHMLDRAAFDAALSGSARKAGAEVRFGVNVRQIGRSGEVELSDGRAIRARVIVGADGPRSLAGRAIGQVNAALVETRQITVPLLKAHDSTDIFLSAEIRGGYAWLFPKGAVANLGAGVEPAENATLKRIVSKLHRELVAQGRVGAKVLGVTGGLIPVGGMLKPWGRLADSMVLLAGDAAGLTNPVTGAGIAAAVHSGSVAGNTAADIVGGKSAAHEDYEDELESIFGPALDRALRRRRELMRAYERSHPSTAALRRGWIAYPEYWMAA